MSKGQSTKASILNQALNLASEIGLEAITIGDLASRIGISKSGLYAHFKSKEALQISVLEAASDRFVDVVLSPSLKKPRGRQRLETLFERWLNWGSTEFDGGCIFVKAATEYSDRTGPVRDRIVLMHKDTIDTLERAIVTAIPTDNKNSDELVSQLAFEFWGILVSYFHYHRLMKREDARSKAMAAFSSLLQRASQ